ncbi:putative MFS-type transporter M2p [[Candida] railenensis]|uniref:MFS-type transporter M2p n=1 Tax=[Candida] railenensis TaxID=45579 RepID=A0A9P0VZH1_9ASCO|nr:putative MFS-type transporter M2p [[Candida] railenensis]
MTDIRAERINSTRLSDAHDNNLSNDVAIAIASERDYLHDNKELSERLGNAHLNILPKKKLIVCLTAMSLGLFISFSDQTSVTIALPHIGADLDANNTINWAGTSALLANCVFQILFGRLSDIFGRKAVLMTCLCILAASDLACGFAQTGVQFYIFRAFAGIGNGGIQSLTMVIVSDIVSLKDRGKYQGYLGANIGLGNAIGPFIMAGFITHSSWRNFYYMMTPLVLLVAVTIFFLVKNQTHEKLDSVLSNKEKFKSIDYLGMLFSSAALTLILIPVSGGGSTYKWNSPLIIAMFVVGGICVCIFLIIEWKTAKLPMIPLRLFKKLSLSIILGSNFFFGMAYYGFMYYMPYYFSIIRNLDVLHVTIFVLPLVLPQSIVSIFAGQVVSYTGHYLPTIIFGYVIWFISCCLLLIWGVDTNYGVCVVILLVMGSGVGCTFQPTLVAAQANARKSERAVVISARNVIRSLGGSIGIAVGSLIVSNSLLNEIKKAEANPQDYGDISQTYLDYLKDHIFNHVQVTGISESQSHVVRGMYMKSVKDFFYLMIPLIAVCLISIFFVKDRGLQCLDEIPEEEKKQNDPESTPESANETHIEQK